MSTKARLISTISAVCLILALLVTGVWAVSTANVTLGGTVTFTADNIHATITGSITGTQETVSITPLVYDADTVPSDEDKATWNNDVNFGSGNLITMTITVQNNSTERSLYVTVADKTSGNNIKKTFASSVDGIKTGDTYEVIKGGTITYTMTISVDLLDFSAEGTYEYAVDLRDGNAVDVLDESKYPYLTFGYCNNNPSGTQLEVTAHSITSENTNLEIPEMVTKDGKVCTVNSLSYNLFKDNTILESIILPATLLTINDDAFRGCTNLTSITIYAKDPPSLPSSATFRDTNANLKIYIPAGSMEEYLADEAWQFAAADKLVEME